jgi:carbon monoxide dehydrogenase subunit G
MKTPLEYRTSVAIAAPPAHVWPILIDVENWYRWTASIRKIERLEQGEFAVGLRVRIFQPKLPPALWRVVSVEQEKSFIWVSSAPGMRVTASHRLEPAAAGSKLDLSITYEGWLGRVMGRLMASLINRYIGLEAAGLKKESERAKVR